MWFFPAAAAVVSAVFAGLLAGQWIKRRRPHLVAWAVALLMFAAASFAAGIGILADWTPTWFRTYYLFGAIANVPVLGVGTIYLLAPRRVGHLAAAVVAVAVIFAAGAVFVTDIDATALDSEGIPPGSEVMDDSVRDLSRYYSFAGFFVVVGGAMWSAWKLARRKEEGLRDLAMGNVLIAAGTFVVAVGSVFARYGRGVVFAVALLIGVSTMFVGFLRTRTRRSPPSTI